jgi:hypothetical protein
MLMDLALDAELQERLLDLAQRDITPSRESVLATHVGGRSERPDSGMGPYGFVGEQTEALL